MNQQTWRVVVDLSEALAKFPKLFKGFDEAKWARWAQHIGYCPRGLSDLVGDESKRMSYRAWALVCSVCGPELVPSTLPWGKPFDTPHWKTTWGLGSHGQLSVEFLHLRYEVVCGIMEQLPASSLFDWSDHPVAVNDLSRLNSMLLRHLWEPESGDPKWRGEPERQRAFNCYRMQGYREHPSEGHERAHFNGFTDLMYDRYGVSDRWKTPAEATMRGLVLRDVAGDTEAEGAFASYVQSVRHWANSGEGRTYPEVLARGQMEFLMDLDGPDWEERIPLDSFGGYSHCFVESGQTGRLLRLAHHYLVEAPPLTEYNEDQSRTWFNLVRLARKTLKVTQEEPLKSAAERIIRLEEERDRPRRVAEAAEEAYRLEGEELLASMK